MAWASWETSSSLWWAEAGDPTTITEIETLTSTIYSTYKLCDGIPRAFVSGPSPYITTTLLDVYSDGNGGEITYTEVSIIEPSPIIVSIITSVITTTLFYDQNPVNEVSTTTNYQIPPPTCTIDPIDCASLYAASSNAMWIGGSFNQFVSPTVVCATQVYTPTASCFIHVPSVQLI